MPRIRETYDPALGPLIELDIGYPQTSWQGAGPPPSIRTVFRVDTGSTCTHIAAAVASQLALPPRGIRKITLADGQTKQVQCYAIDIIERVSGRIFSNLEAREFSPFNSDFSGILGRDVLDLGMLTVDGPGRSLTFDF